MPDPELPVAVARADLAPAPAPNQGQLFDKLRELARHGYVPGPDAPGVAREDILLRHETGPNLILKRDGTLDLPIAQTPKPQPASATLAPMRRMSKRRTAAFILFALAFWMFSMFITALIMDGM